MGNQGVGRALISLRSLEENLSLSLLAPGGPCSLLFFVLGQLNDSSTMSSHGLCPGVCAGSPNLSLLIRRPVIGLRPTPIQGDHIFTSLHLQRLNFQIRSHSQVPGLRTPMYLLRGHNSIHNTGCGGCKPASLSWCKKQSSGVFQHLSSY